MPMSALSTRASSAGQISASWSLLDQNGAVGPVITSSSPPVDRWPWSAPDLLGSLDDQPELGDLLVPRQRVALDGRGEPALPGEGQLVQRHVPRRLLDPPLEVVLALEFGPLRRHQAEDDALARRHETQRLEAARAGVVVLEEEPVDVQAAEQCLRDEVVAALGDP